MLGTIRGFLGTIRGLSGASSLWAGQGQSGVVPRLTGAVPAAEAWCMDSTARTDGVRTLTRVAALPEYDEYAAAIP